MEIECFVLVACPENSLVDAKVIQILFSVFFFKIIIFIPFMKDFLRPIITPYELEVALMAEQIWTGRYISQIRNATVSSWYA